VCSRSDDRDTNTAEACVSIERKILKKIARVLGAWAGIAALGLSSCISPDLEPPSSSTGAPRLADNRERASGNAPGASGTTASAPSGAVVTTPGASKGPTTTGAAGAAAAMTAPTAPGGAPTAGSSPSTASAATPANQAGAAGSGAGQAGEAASDADTDAGVRETP